jgi:hypothetical protein
MISALVGRLDEHVDDAVASAGSRRTAIEKRAGASVSKEVLNLTRGGGLS